MHHDASIIVFLMNWTQISGLSGAPEGGTAAWSGGCCCPNPAERTCWSSSGSTVSCGRSRTGGVRWRSCRSRGCSSCWGWPAGRRASRWRFQSLQGNRGEHRLMKHARIIWSTNMSQYFFSLRVSYCSSEPLNAALGISWVSETLFGSHNEILQVGEQLLHADWAAFCVFFTVNGWNLHLHHGKLALHWLHIFIKYQNVCLLFCGAVWLQANDPTEIIPISHRDALHVFILLILCILIDDF